MQGLSFIIVRYFYDTEFIEDGRTIELVSIGIVAEDGREYYAVSTDFDPARANAWVRENVLEKLPSPRDPVWKSKDTIREEVLAFLTKDKAPMQLWAWVGAYDHVVLAQLWGDMAGLPRSIPRYTRELRQYWEFPAARSCQPFLMAIMMLWWMPAITWLSSRPVRRRSRYLPATAQPS